MNKDDNAQMSSDVELGSEMITSQSETLAIIPTGTLLGDIFSVQGKIGSVNHGDVYDVKALPNSDMDMNIGYEARAFQLDDLPPQLKAYRTRAIRRLSGRSVLRIAWQGLHVVVYQTGDLPQECQSQVKPEVPVESTSPTSAVSKNPKIKSTRQRESDRLRQKSRRQRNRQRKQGEKSVADESEPLDGQGQNKQQNKSTVPIHIESDDFAFFEVLDSMQNIKSRCKLSDVARDVVEDYLRAKDREVALDDEDALSDLIAVKEREMVYLRRQHSKYLPVLANWTAYLAEIWPPNDEPPWLRDLFFRKKKGFTDQYEIFKHGFDILSRLIAESESKVHSMRLQLAVARRARKHRDTRQSAKYEQKKLAKKIKNYRKWVLEVVPLSAPYEDVLGELTLAEDALRELNLAEEQLRTTGV